MSFKLPQFKIVVAGIGGAGCNVVDQMIKTGARGIQFISLNTDPYALSRSLADNKIHIRTNRATGLGGGGNPETVEKAMLECRDEVGGLLRGGDMVIITCGFGGGTGTGGAPVLAQWAKEAGIFTLVVVTKPYSFEGKRRGQIAEEGIQKLHQHADAVVLISGDAILKMIDRRPLTEAFSQLDEVVACGISGIVSLTRPGPLNMDI